jgi:predicted DNA-binding transcriptional regulator AlpA
LQKVRNTAEPAIANSETLQTYEFIDSKELALRWGLAESWIREQVRARSMDTLPHVRFGKYVRFRWGSPELEAWAERRIVSTSNRVGGRALGKESK